MATVNYSVPEEVKKNFNRTFKGQNKSAVIAELMQRAVVEAEVTKRRRKLFEQLTARRAQRPRVTDAQIRAARMRGRP